MARSKKGQATGEIGRSADRVNNLREFTAEAEAQSDLKTWRRLAMSRVSRLTRWRANSPGG